MASAPLDLRAIAVDAIAAAAGLPPKQLTDDVDLMDLGLDSVDFWKILLDIEDHIGVEVPSAVLDRLTQLDGEVTVGDLSAAFGTWDPNAEGSTLL